MIKEFFAKNKALLIGLAVGIIIGLAIVGLQANKVAIGGDYGFEKNNTCRLDSCSDAVKGVCGMKTEKGAVVSNINDIRRDCNLGGPLTFEEIKSFCNVSEDYAIQKVCNLERCTTNADCDDGNPETVDRCVSICIGNVCEKGCEHFYQPPTQQ
jgi:hypothetical protein